MALKKKDKRWFIFLGVLLVFSFLEGATRGVERFQKHVLSPRLEGVLSEFHFYYDNRKRPISYFQDRENYDSLLGWRNKSFRKEKINSEGFRIPYAISPHKTKLRIALLGDSHIFGLNVGDEHTLSAYLQSKLSDSVEVLNFGVRGFSIDQMTLLATRILPQFKPDIILLGTHSQNLIRSCRSFIFESPKPYFSKQSKEWILNNIPVPTLLENYKKHWDLKSRTWDAMVGRTRHFRFLNVLGELAYKPYDNHCVEELNTFLIQNIKDFYGEKVPLLIFHTEGEMPSWLNTHLSKTNIPFLSIDEEVSSRSKENYRFGDGHPTPLLNKKSAEILFQKLNSLGWVNPLKALI